MYTLKHNGHAQNYFNGEKFVKFKNDGTYTTDDKKEATFLANCHGVELLTPVETTEEKTPLEAPNELKEKTPLEAFNELKEKEALEALETATPELVAELVKNARLKKVQKKAAEMIAKTEEAAE